MWKFSAVLALLLGPNLAEARCVSRADLNTGIRFTLEDGHTGFVVAAGDKVIVDYASDTRESPDWHETYFGLFDVKSNYQNYNFSEVVFPEHPPTPSPDTKWKIRVVRNYLVDLGTVHSVSEEGAEQIQRWSFESLREVELSGCQYKVFTGLVRLSPPDDLIVQYLYFPELGFGLKTRYSTKKTSHRNGLTAMRPAH